MIYYPFIPIIDYQYIHTIMSINKLKDILLPAKLYITAGKWARVFESEYLRILRKTNLR